jgi:hypothetical protein
MINFKNKNILITGASGGIGNELVRKFVSLGGNVLGSGTKAEKLDLLKKRYPNLFTLIFGYRFFNKSSFSALVPLPRTLPPSETNFLTSSLPIPPLAPVIKIFLFLKLIIFNIIYRINI